MAVVRSDTAPVISDTGLPSKIAGQLATLDANASKWHALGNSERAAVARQCRAQLATLDLGWVTDNMKCVGLEPSSRDAHNTFSFDPFLFMSTVASRLDKIVEALEGHASDFRVDKSLPEGGPDVYKMGDVSRGAPGVSLELWASPEGSGQSDPTSEQTAGIGVVLGAGNQNFLTVVDALEVAFRHKKCVFLKHHPIRPFMAAPIGHIFQPLLDFGAYGQCKDNELNGAHSALVTYKGVKHVHMTGSTTTHNRVRDALDEAGRGDVLFTSELGCVTPWIVCPGKTNGGKWDQAAIVDHATMLAAAFKSSCSMNCLSPKVLVLPSEAVWPQRQDFMKALREQIATIPQPPPYYPGAHKRFAAFAQQYPNGEQISAPPSQDARYALPTAEYQTLGQDITTMPSLLVDVGTIGDKDCLPYALETEAFAPILAIATVACERAEDFPRAAAEAVNEHVFGTLSCNVIYPDERDEVLDNMLRALNYGCVAVNCWAALLYSNPLGVWGGAPGSYTASESNSGLGFVGNAAGIPRPLKSVGLSAFANKNVIMGAAMPYLLADMLTILVAGKKFAPMRIMGLIFRRLFGILPKPLPGGRCYSA